MSEDESGGQHVPATLVEALEDIVFRFVVPIPEEELFQSERLFFHLEQAWWYYEDEIADRNPKLPHFKDQTFYRQVFAAAPQLKPLIPRFDQMYADFSDYKFQIPLFGLALMTADLSKVLLVRSHHGQTWSLPRGKMNEEEDPLVCAIREVYEETGFDATSLKPGREDVVTYPHRRTGMNGQTISKTVTIFIVSGVPEDYPFQPRVKKEIDEIKWWKLSELAALDIHDRKKTFWGIHPCFNQLLKWVARKQGRHHEAQGPKADEGLELEEDVGLTGGATSGRGRNDYTFEDMIRINKELRQKELQEEKNKSSKSSSSKANPKDASGKGVNPAKGEKSTTRTNPTTKLTKVTVTGTDDISKKATIAAKKQLKQPQQQQSAAVLPRKILTRLNVQSTSSTGDFTINWEEVRLAMRPMLYGP